ncbi:11121_t:CDS:2 [Ambispora gerdemannii]|uniref:11121_t:CDS:1 n=1 Tax=Ambispora gerdemannii TaxID=144530 RepID=A0A9N9DJZ3_9GLOM|nr:11121_t:CDS:2 [Ambispora gerdemannii]
MELMGNDVENSKVVFSWSEMRCKAGAEADALVLRSKSLMVKAKAGVNFIDIETKGVKAKIGVNVDMGASIGLDGIEAKIGVNLEEMDKFQ